jgi:hypothetical protein
MKQARARNYRLSGVKDRAAVSADASDVALVINPG